MKNESKICRRRKEKKQDNWLEPRIRMRVIDQKLRERERERERVSVLFKVKAKWRLRIKKKWWITYDVHWLMWYTLWLFDFTHRLLYSICFTHERERERERENEMKVFHIFCMLFSFCCENTCLSVIEIRIRSVIFI